MTAKIFVCGKNDLIYTYKLYSISKHYSIRHSYKGEKNIYNTKNCLKNNGEIPAYKEHNSITGLGQ